MKQQRFQPTDALVSPRFADIPTFMRLPHVPDPRELDIALVGVPFDGGTTYRAGARLGPRHIRVQSALIRPYHPTLRINPFERYRIADYGDISVNPLSIEDSFRRIEVAIDELLVHGVRPISVGGDHSIALPILRAMARRHQPLSVIHFDAHSDTWDEYFGSKYSHGTPFRRAIEEGLIDPTRMLQVGLRGQVYGEEDFEFARSKGIEFLSTEDIFERGIPWVIERFQRFRGTPCYLTFDIDVVDPAFAPGTGTPQIGGPSSREIVALVRGLQGLAFVGADLVEVSPPYDSAEITSLLAANLLFEFLCLMSCDA
ncbi:MAG TPA: agmatinase [Alphaproteobacteria bacterium]|nr:agmatinase [Alphaproteobacteria bacterium]